MEWYIMFGDLEWPLNASHGLSAIAEFLVRWCSQDSIVQEQDQNQNSKEQDQHRDQD